MYERVKFADGAAYEKKSADMKQLTEIENKIKQAQELTKDDLIFIYEINNKIQGFGYQRDPRIAEILATRKPREDAPIVLECEPSQIAWSEQEINQNTKAYIGPLFGGYSKKTSNIFILNSPGVSCKNTRQVSVGQRPRKN